MSTKLTLLKGDITKIKVDAIVNAANSGLRGGGGVDGAIHRAGGATIMKECDKIRDTQGGCPTGGAVITSAGNLPSKYVIHAVGPVWYGGNKNEKELLAGAYRSSLSLAIQHGIKSVALPNISTGVYNFPKNEAAHIAIKETKKFISANDSLQEIIFVCYDDENYSIYQQLLHN